MCPPTTFYADNGGEFANDEFRELGNKYNIVIKHTAAYSFWANGLNERNHASNDLMMEKMIEDYSTMPVDLALQYAVCCQELLFECQWFLTLTVGFRFQPKTSISIL